MIKQRNKESSGQASRRPSSPKTCFKAGQCVKVFHIPAQFHDLVFAVVILAAIAFARLFFQFFERPFLGSLRKQIEHANPVAAALKVT